MEDRMTVRVPADSTWSYAAAANGIIDAVAVAAKAAVADKRHYVRSVQLANSDATVATEFTISTASTVLFRTFLPAGRPASLTAIPAYGLTFDPPLRGGVNEAINIQAVTTSGEVYANLQGYTQ
jgi:hypothetical protein